MVGVIPEMIISRSSGEAIVIKFCEKYTRLTGSTRYAIFSCIKEAAVNVALVGSSNFIELTDIM